MMAAGARCLEQGTSDVLQVFEGRFGAGLCAIHSRLVVVERPRTALSSRECSGYGLS